MTPYVIQKREAMKPRASQDTPENAARFQEQGVADVYHLRLPHPNGVFTKLASLLPEQPRTILDVGTGTGDLARRLTSFAERVDAIDISAPMLLKGREAPGGDHAALHWIHGRMEELDPQRSYGLVTAGGSIRWMDWDIVFPKFHGLLAPRGFLALVSRYERPVPWQDELTELIAEYSVYRRWQSYDLIEELIERGHFHLLGDWRTPPDRNRQSVVDYVMSWHSRGGLARETMSADTVAAFDSALRDLVAPWVDDGHLRLQTEGRVTWGRPLVIHRE